LEVNFKPEYVPFKVREIAIPQF